MTTTSPEAIVAAVNLLYGTATSQEKSAADATLRRWQQSFDAWAVSDALLAAPVGQEVIQTAAMTLRIKIMYDLTQLPPDSFGPLCNLILGHLRRYQQQKESRGVMSALCLALADLSVHMGAASVEILTILAEQFSQPKDMPVLLLCLKYLPEENENDSVLAEPTARREHTDVLKTHFSQVMARLKNILETSADRDICLKALECMVAWISFFERTLDRTGSSERTDCLPACFADVSLTILREDTTSADRVADLLTEAIYITTWRPAGYEAFLRRMLGELTDSTGLIRNLLLSALSARDSQAILRLSLICRHVCCGNCDTIVESLELRASALLDLFPLIVRITTIPYDPTDEAYGHNGAATQMLDFWDAFTVGVHRRRQKLLGGIGWSTCCSPEGTSKDEISPAGAPASSSTRKTAFPEGLESFSGSTLSQAKADSVASSIAEIFAAQNGVLQTAMSSLLSLCTMPKAVVLDPEAYASDFYSFREEVWRTMWHIAKLLGRESVIEQLLLSLSSNACSDADGLVSQEAHLSCLGHLCTMLENDKSLEMAGERAAPNPSIDEGDQSGRSASQAPPHVTLLCQLTESLTRILTPEPPSTYMISQTRIAAGTLIARVAPKLPLHTMQDLVSRLVECLGHQVFRPELQKDATSDHAISSDTPFLIKHRHHLCFVCANAIRCLSVCCQSCVTLQNHIAPHLVKALLLFPRLPESVYTTILEGVVVVIAAIESEVMYAKARDELLEAIMKSLVSTDHMDSAMTELDRLSLVLRFIKPEESQKSRMKALAMFFTARLWPVVKHLLETKADCAHLVEKSCRTLKHGMRCVSGELCTTLVAPLAQIIAGNAKTVRLHPTYLYVAEWLVVEYYEDREVLATLRLLFDELTLIALRSLRDHWEATPSTAPFSEDAFLAEDLFGMHCRYLRYCPTIPALSPSLPQMFDILQPSLLKSGRVIIEMVCSYLATIAYTKRTSESEEGSVGASPRTVRQTLECISSQLTLHLKAIIRTLFQLILTIPPRSVIHRVGATIKEFQKSVDNTQLEEAVREGVQILPAAVLASASYRNSIVERLTRDSHGVYELLEELYARCRQTVLRLKELEASS